MYNFEHAYMSPFVFTGHVRVKGHNFPIKVLENELVGRAKLAKSLE